jgi:putative addiction module component (TIGR02574 family)
MNVEELSVPQRLDMIGVLWDSIPDSPEALPVPEWHQQELERRLAEADADPGASIPWEQVKQQLQGKQ